jgi:hypothetical protein
MIGWLGIEACLRQRSLHFERQQVVHRLLRKESYAVERNPSPLQGEEQRI